MREDKSEHRAHMITWMRVKRGVRMTPVYVSLDASLRFGSHDEPKLNDRVLEWLEAQGLADDRHSDDWTYYHDSEEAAFFFREARVAMLFKLAFA